MDLRALRYFSAVYEERSVTAAARLCFVSQPSISTALAGLERDLETQLFVRHKKGATPTASAEQLYPIARRMVDEAEAVKTLFRKPRARRELTLGLMRALDLTRTSEILRQLPRTAGLQLRLVGAGDICDARIISRSMLQSGEQFIPLWTEPYVVAIPSTHRLAIKIKLLVSDLVGEQVIDRPYCEQNVLSAPGDLNLETVAVAQSEEWALALVAAGVGIAVMPRGAARAGPSVVVREVSDVRLTRQVGLAYGRSPSSDLIGLIDSISTLS
jgi:DNA-binding transcriptional LysR family regulator